MKNSLTVQKRTRFAFASFTKKIAFFFLGLFFLYSGKPASAQDVAGRISFGFDVGGNKYWGNFTDNHFGFSGDLFIRWNILDFLSLHAMYNAGLLKYKSSVLDPPLTQPVGSINSTRHGGWDLALSYNVFPDETFVPYLMLGLEALNFEPKDAGNNNLPHNAQGPNQYSKNVIGGILGLGFEMFITDKVTFNGKILLHLTGTDWLDDYTSGPPNNTQDVFMTFGLGFSYYIFAPALPEKTEVVTPPANTTNITNVYNTNVIKGDTVVITETDTVYKTKILKGTIYNFPGTLFIVNTDEFNTNMPGNIQNLHNIKTLMNQCPELKVEIQGHASHEGTVARNQELSDMRAAKIKHWLIDQGVDPNKIVSTVGLGTSDDAVYEPTNSTPAQLEAARILNRRISIKVVEGCQ